VITSAAVPTKAGEEQLDTGAPEALEPEKTGPKAKPHKKH